MIYLIVFSVWSEATEEKEVKVQLQGQQKSVDQINSYHLAEVDTRLSFSKIIVPVR